MAADLLAHSLAGLSLGGRPAPSLSFSSSMRGTALPGAAHRQSVAAAAAGRPGTLVIEAKQNALKRQRQTLAHRAYNKSHISACRTRFKKALRALETSKELGQESQIFPIEKLISEAHSEFDKAVKRGIMHKNTVSRRKQRLANKKRALLAASGLYFPELGEPSDALIPPLKKPKRRYAKQAEKAEAVRAAAAGEAPAELPEISGAAVAAAAA